jgi:hypothetical protein
MRDYHHSTHIQAVLTQPMIGPPFSLKCRNGSPAGSTRWLLTHTRSNIAWCDYLTLTVTKQSSPLPRRTLSLLRGSHYTFPQYTLYHI